mmetsp:Transcript_93391/g.264384  ORF Transcript_93391/g.264384 Transcript_93391/m.264384 type:complete len:448 (+) Transcript_93391:181-1524(+)
MREVLAAYGTGAPEDGMPLRSGLLLAPGAADGLDPRAAAAARRHDGGPLAELRQGVSSAEGQLAQLQASLAGLRADGEARMPEGLGLACEVPEKSATCCGREPPGDGPAERQMCARLGLLEQGLTRLEEKQAALSQRQDGERRLREESLRDEARAREDGLESVVQTFGASWKYFMRQLREKLEAQLTQRLQESGEQLQKALRHELQSHQALRAQLPPDLEERRAVRSGAIEGGVTADVRRAPLATELEGECWPCEQAQGNEAPWPVMAAGVHEHSFRLLQQRVEVLGGALEKELAGRARREAARDGELEKLRASLRGEAMLGRRALVDGMESFQETLGKSVAALGRIEAEIRGAPWKRRGSWGQKHDARSPLQLNIIAEAEEPRPRIGAPPRQHPRQAAPPAPLAPAPPVPLLPEPHALTAIPGPPCCAAPVPSVPAPFVPPNSPLF